jgi:putative two-component system response regulator
MPASSIVVSCEALRVNALAAVDRNYCQVDSTKLRETVRHVGYTDHGSIAERARERTRFAENTQSDTLRRLTSVAELCDGDAGGHPHRVGELAAWIGSSLNLPEHRVELIRIAASLHDIGKIGIPDEILLKPGKLTADEYEKIKAHTTIGSAILSGSRFPSLQLAEKIALYHHERWDGTGYWGIHAGAIPVEARIVSIADTFDVLTHQRPYKQAWSVSDAVAEIKSQSGRQFDPRLVDVFMVDAFTRFAGSIAQRLQAIPTDTLRRVSQRTQ